MPNARYYQKAFLLTKPKSYLKKYLRGVHKLRNVTFFLIYPLPPRNRTVTKNLLQIRAIIYDVFKLHYGGSGIKPSKRQQQLL